MAEARTDGAASGKPNLFGLSRVAREEGKAKEEGEAKSSTISGLLPLLFPYIQNIKKNQSERITIGHWRVIYTEMTTETYIEMAARQRAELLRMARDFLHDEAEAEDAVQESLLRLWLMRERIAQPRDFCLLAVRITKNVCISLWRKHQGRQMLPLEALTSLESSMRCDGVEEAENSRLLREAVDSLPPSYRRIFHLWRQGMEIQEIAIVAGAKPRTVSSMLSAARARILARLKQIS